MPYGLRYSPEALIDLKRLRSHDRAAILGQIQRLLTVNPALESQARIKMLRPPAPTRYRLRVGAFRVFYNVRGNEVFVVRVMAKVEAEASRPEEQNGDREDQP
jgi:mRNA-degrading endonuclease RelE of RelBE toxin-antitoxin system